MAHFKIYQLNGDNEELLCAHFNEWLNAGDYPERKMYECTWFEDCEIDLEDDEAVHAFLETIFTRFNIDRPARFEGHSMSVSDVVVLCEDMTDEWEHRVFYTDMIGFQELDFKKWRGQNAFAAWLTDNKQGGALGMLAQYDKAVLA